MAHDITTTRKRCFDSDDDCDGDECNGWDFKRLKAKPRVSSPLPTPNHPVTANTAIDVIDDKPTDKLMNNSSAKSVGQQRRQITYNLPIPPPSKIQHSALLSNIKNQNSRPQQQEITIYTDGGYAGQRSSIGVWLGDGHPYNVSRLLPPYIQDNNIAELEAASEAIYIAIQLGIKQVLIITDSAHVFKLYERIKTMRREAHLLRLKQTPIYMNYKLCYIRFIRLIHSPRINVRFQQVKGHSGIDGNEEADQLASLALVKAGFKKSL